MADDNDVTKCKTKKKFSEYISVIASENRKCLTLSIVIRSFKCTLGMPKKKKEEILFCTFDVAVTLSNE